MYIYIHTHTHAHTHTHTHIGFLRLPVSEIIVRGNHDGWFSLQNPLRYLGLKLLSY
jgi:hypothetical protein